MDSRNLISGMTLKEKIGQLTQIAYIPQNIEGIEDRIRQGRVGSIILSHTAFAGKEVVQCYVSDETASMMRPIRELKGFQKVFLEKGEEREITFRLGYDKFGFYGKDNRFIVEDGTFTVYMGGNSFCENELKL